MVSSAGFAAIPVADADEAALQVVYLPPPAASPRPPEPRRSRRAAPTTHAPGLQARFVEPSLPAASPPQVDLSPAGIRRQLEALPADAVERTTASPLHDRAASLPGRDGGRFRMRKPLAPADVVAGIGRLFYAGGGADPCPRNRHNITELQDGHDPAALQQELAFERRHCRP